MSRWREICAQGARAGLGAASLFAFWVLWLALVVLLGLQLYVASTNELAVPDFLLRRIESKLAESGLRVAFNRSSFDPTGRVLVENLRLSLPTFPEPILSARSAYVHVNPWLGAIGKVEPREIRLTGATAAVPAMFSPSGRPEEIVHDLDATLVLDGNILHVRQLSTRIAGLTVTAQGAVRIPRVGRERTDALADFIANRFPSLCRQVLAAVDQLAQFDNPALHIELSPSESGAGTINATFFARALTLSAPIDLQASGLRASTRLVLFGDMPTSHIEVAVEELRLPQIIARGTTAAVFGRFGPDGLRFETRVAQVGIAALTVSGFTATAIAAELVPRPLPRLEASATALLMESPLSLRADANVATRSAEVRFDGSISPAVLDPIAARTQADIRRFFDFEVIQCDNGRAQIGPGWKFETLSAHLRLDGIRARGVTFDEGRAQVEFDGRRFHSPDAFARVGENFARGSYTHDLPTREFRFLLDGRLRPMDISGWFAGWWANFFRQLEFPAAPPRANVDVQGVWREGRRAAVFVFADAASPVIRGASLDRGRTRLFIRPSFVDGLEVLATRGEGLAAGRFTRASDPATRAWRTLDLDLDSTLDLDTARLFLGQPTARILDPFKVAQAPAVKLQGRLAGPGAGDGEHHALRIRARAPGDFRFHNFPLQDVSFDAMVKHNEILVADIEAMAATGVVGGRARIWGAGAERRLGFDAMVKDASLGLVAGALEEFFAARAGRAPAPPGKFVQEKANVRLDLAASAEGRYDDVFSYHGDGNVVLRGAEIGEVPLLGMLSELLKFTTLRLTEARANFRIEGPRLAFPEVTLRGANSSIDAHGFYALDRRELDFNAKIFPFQESGNILKSVMGAVLTPLSNFLEVKLTGTLTKPEWAFVIGPTNFLRSLNPDPSASPSTLAPPPASPSGSPEPASPQSDPTREPASDSAPKPSAATDK